MQAFFYTVTKNFLIFFRVEKTGCAFVTAARGKNFHSHKKIVVFDNNIVAIGLTEEAV